MILATMGELEEALPYLEESVALAERVPYPEALRSGHAVLAEQDLLRGEPDAALARLEPLVEGSEPEDLGTVRLLPLLAQAYLEAGDGGRAEEVALEGVERARAQGNRLALAELLRVRGMVLAREHRGDQAERAFDEAVSVARSIGFPYAEARALYEWGSSPHVGGRDPEQAQDRLEEAVEIFERLGSRPYADLARKALAGSD